MGSRRQQRTPPRVLIVEDDAEMRQWVKELLEEEGYETLAAPDALTGVMLLLADGADLVVTDWRMPGCDGLGLLESVRRISPRIPIVFMTAYADAGTRYQMRDRGAFSVLQKPFRGSDLLRHVRTALEFSGDG